MSVIDNLSFILRDLAGRALIPDYRSPSAEPAVREASGRSSVPTVRIDRNPGRRSFEFGKHNRLALAFGLHVRHIDSLLIHYLRAMRARSRQLARNNPYFKRFLSSLETNVVGAKGFTYQNRSEDEAINTALEAAYRDWSRKGFCTVDGKWSRATLERMIVRLVALDGECFLRKVRRRGVGGAYGFAYQYINPDRIDENYNELRQNGSYIRMGIEFDAANRPVAYYVDTYHPAADLLQVPGKKYRERVLASDIIHIYRPIEVEQSRGAPWVYAAGLRSYMLDDYEEAELTASRAAASKMGFYETNGDEDFQASDPDPNDPTAETVDEAGNLLQTLEPGVLEQLPNGVKFTSFDPQHPTQQYGEFVRFMLLSIAVGLDASYHDITGDLTKVSFSSIRAGSISERDCWRVLQQFFIDEYLEPAHREWAEHAVMVGAPPVKSLNIADFDFYYRPEFMARGWDWVDPLKDIQAVEKEYAMGLTSLTAIAASKGRDIEEVFRQRQRERDLAEEYGVKIGGSSSTVIEDKEETDDEDSTDVGDGDAKGGRSPGGRIGGGDDAGEAKIVRLA